MLSIKARLAILAIVVGLVGVGYVVANGVPGITEAWGFGARAGAASRFVNNLPPPGQGEKKVVLEHLGMV